MPVTVKGKTFATHAEAVAYLKKHFPRISDPDAYVAYIERAQNEKR